MHSLHRAQQSVERVDLVVRARELLQLARLSRRHPDYGSHPGAISLTKDDEEWSQMYDRK